MGLRLLPASRVRCTRPFGTKLKSLLLPKGLFAKRAKRIGKAEVERKGTVVEVKAKDVDLDWSERSREVFETAMGKGTEYGKAALGAWESADDKPTVIAVGLGVLLGLYAANATLGAMENVPLLGSTLKIVGLYVTGWFLYRMIAFEMDRDEVVASVKTLREKIIGD